MDASLDALGTGVATLVRWVPTIALAWLALFFGATLRRGATPLIERVARVGKPDLSPALVRYTRVLTWTWCVHFALAATASAWANPGFLRAGMGVAALSALLFVGEYGVRRLLFPHEYFPNLVEQVRDTASVWRPRRHG